MGYKTRAFFLLFIIVWIILTFRLSDRLPIPEKTSGKNEKNAFSGVLRLWIFEKNPIGAKNLSVWLNSESAKFEKKNDGIYIQITPVSEKTILNFATAGVYPPDMIAVTPGILPDEDSLMDLSAIPVLTKTDNFPSSCLIPVASGGHAWAINREEVPDGILSGKILYISDSVSPLSAVAALCAEQSSIEETPSNRFGIDLSLPESDEKSSSGTKSVSGEIIPGIGSMRTKDALSSFKKGLCDAALLNISEIVSLTNASDAPDFEIVPAGERCTEDVLYFAVTSTDKTSAPEKQKVCKEFLLHLLSEEAQMRLSSVSAFPVIDCTPLYTGKKWLNDMEMHFSAGKIFFPDPTKISDPSHESALNGFLSGNAGARAYYRSRINP